MIQFPANIDGRVVRYARYNFKHMNMVRTRGVLPYKSDGVLVVPFRGLNLWIAKLGC